MEEQNKWSFVNALHKKYSNDKPLRIFIHVPKGAPGKEDSGDLVVPTCLVINNAKISCAGDEEEVRKACHRVCELDIADNNISDIREVLKLLDGMPCVSFLNLTANPLKDSLVKSEDKTYPKVTQLVLNKIRSPMPAMCAILDNFPNLVEVHLSLNGLTTVDILDENTYSSVTKLYLNDNKIADWGNVNKVGKLFPNLDQLIMVKNPLSAIGEKDIQEAVGIFSKLHSLNISYTDFHSWTDIERLRKLDNLSDLRLQGCRLWQDLEEEIRRQLAIGYLPNILSLNGTPVSDTERDEAERAFIRFYMEKEEEKPNRFHELEQKHGKLDRLACVDISREEKITVTFHNSDMEEQNKWSFVNALHKKYSNEQLRILIPVPKGAPGKEDSGDFVVPPCLVINNAKISCAGDEEEVRKACHRVCELDIAYNNISDFREVLKLLDGMPCVSFLNLTANPIKNSLVKSEDKTYPKVTQLVLNKIRSPLPAMCAILDNFPNLVEVHLSLNGLTTVDVSDGNTYPSVSKLYLNDNNIADWGSVNKIGKLFPNLDQLIMVKNPLSLISETDIQEALGVFSKLRSLNISNTEFHSWTDIERLRKLENLSDLRLQGCQLWQDLEEEIRRQLAIGKKK